VTGSQYAGLTSLFISCLPSQFFEEILSSNFNFNLGNILPLTQYRNDDKNELSVAEKPKGE
jgi:hypothetical protein